MVKHKVTKAIFASTAILSLSLALVGCGKKGGDYKPKKLTVGFTPSVNGSQMNAETKPLAKQLEKQLKIPVTVKISTDGNSLVQAMGSKTLDVAEMAPGQFNVAQKNYNVIPLAQATRLSRNPKTLDFTNRSSKNFKSTIVVRKDSGINKLSDLKGKKIAVGNANATAGWIYPVVELEKDGININSDGIKTNVIPDYGQSILSVVNKNNDAAFTFQGAQTLVKKDDPNVMNQTKVLYTSKASIPNDAVACRSDMSPKWQKKIKRAYIDLGKTKEGRAIINKIYQETGYTNFDGKEYKQVANFTNKANQIAKKK